jgi:hypothetical protein
MRRCHRLSAYVLLASLGLLTHAGIAAPAPRQPVRILILSSAATREYQFLRNLLAREQEAKRLSVRIHLQSIGEERIRSRDMDSLERFPTQLKAKDDTKEERDKSLQSFDLIIAIDPDWLKLKEEQRKLLADWVAAGGGLIVVGGPIHSGQLVPPLKQASLQVIADLLPVQLESLARVERETDQAKRLNFGSVKREMTFLKLNAEGLTDLAGWDEYFLAKRVKGEESKLAQGFYSAFPVKAVRKGALVLARLGSPDGKEEKAVPYLATWAVEQGQVFWIGSGETWRLRQTKEAYHQRFWNELIRFVSLGASSLKS